MNTSNNFRTDSPVIITGRGGSGTRLISQLLGSAPFFLGTNLNDSGDSMSWVPLSRDLLYANARLSDGSFNDAWAEKFRVHAAAFLEDAPRSGLEQWGWKLPEMMFCLPEMKHTFPNARFVHLVRHPVSLCLRRTHTTSRMNNKVGETVLTRAYPALGLDSAEIMQRSDAFNNAVSWVYQVGPLVQWAASNLVPEDYLLVRYEDIVANQARVLEELTTFIGIDADESASLTIEPDRINQHFEDMDPAEVESVWSLCGKVAEQLGYSREL